MGTFRLVSRVDDLHEAASELLDDHPLLDELHLLHAAGLLGLSEETGARRLRHVRRHEGVRQPAGREEG